ncbi:OPT family oligopeptide transporter [Archangium sp.]|uniref:OPT family oligopeptide transporter n=1 Tax=Archangium sp. TaxID=1872627 RepID=UPI00286B5AF5|nr:OPT family oligopeptide transporter [Archangium sp.]
MSSRGSAVEKARLPAVEPESPPPVSDTRGALTARALALGSGIGAVMSLSNLYVGLKTGLAFPVALIACVVGFGTHRVLASRLSLREASALQSTASSAGYATGGTLISASVAWLMLAGQHPPGWALFLWTLLVSALGVFFAVPLQRAFLRREPLAFPTGLAAASATRALHAGDEDGRRGAWALGVSALGAGLVTFAREVWRVLPAALPLPGTLRGVPLASYSFALETGLLPLGAGMLVGPRIGVSLLLGALTCFGLLVPWLHARGTLAAPDFLTALDWSMWPGTAMVTSASFTALLLQPGALRRSLGALRLFPGAPGEARDSTEEVPRRWFLVGTGALTLATVALGHLVFGVPAHLGLLGVVLSYGLAVVACRVTGETDVNPSGPLGQVAQLAFGVWLPGNTQANTVAASLAGTTAASSADLLTDVKAGLLLGATPRQTFLAQLWGCLVGSVVIVPAFLFLVPDTSVLSEEHFPVPAGHFVVGVARVLASGLGALSEAARWGVLGGLLAGLGLALAERQAPEPLRRFVPSPLAVGLAFALPASLSLSLFLGSLVGPLLARVWPDFARAGAVPLAAGLIVGESLTSLGLALVTALRG